jgi:hypothetical protein
MVDEQQRLPVPFLKRTGPVSQALNSNGIWCFLRFKQRPLDRKQHQPLECSHLNGNRPWRQQGPTIGLKRCDTDFIVAPSDTLHSCARRR